MSDKRGVNGKKYWEVCCNNDEIIDIGDGFIFRCLTCGDEVFHTKKGPDVFRLNRMFMAWKKYDKEQEAIEAEIQELKNKAILT